MRTAAGWAVIGVLGAILMAAAAEQKPAPPPPLPPGGAGPAPAPPGVAPAEPSAPATIPEVQLDPVIAGLVADLGSPDYKVREKAGATLEAKGEKALPQLRVALGKTENPEVARRLSVLVRKMDYDRLVAPKRITLAMKDKPVKDVLDEITKQTGYKFEYQPGGPGEKHTFEFDKMPFWQAVDKVANAAGMVVYTDYDDEIVRIYNQDSYNPHIAYAGPFRFMATQINTNRSIQLSGISRRGGFNNRQQEYINLSFQIQSEPKNPILGATQAELSVATDDTGVSLVPPKDPNNFNRSNYGFNGGSRGHNAYAGVNLVRGGRDATAIKVLKGKVGIIMLSGTIPELIIPEPAKVKNKKFAARSAELDIDSVTEANGQYTVSLTARQLGGGGNEDDPNDYNWNATIGQRLELVDEKGNKYRNYGPNINNANGGLSMTVQFGPDDRRGRPAKIGPPAKLVFNEWLSVTHEVTFEFRDIPLP